MDCVMANCLPTATARMTRRGLQFADLYYRPTENSIPEFEAMQVRAATREWTEEVTYHPAAARTLWLHRGDERIAMELSDESSGRADWTLFDVEGDLETSRAVGRDEETRNAPCDAATECAVENVVQKAKRQTEEVRGKPSQRRKSGPEKLHDRKSQADAIRGVPNRPASVDPTAGIPRNLAERDKAVAIAAIRRARASRSPEETEK